MFIVGAAQAEEFVAQIIAVIDGDTVLIRRAHGVLKVRLADIDAPEVGHAGMGAQSSNSQEDQPYGAESRRALSEQVQGRQVKFVSQAMDQYGRMVAHLSIDGVDVNATQIRQGMAWEYSHYHGNHKLVALQAEAQQASRGLWAMADPMPPWEWRKTHAHAFTQEHAVASSSSKSDDPSCAQKKRCAQMSSCDEARHYFSVCKEKYLDGNHDGVPCEKLCASHAKNHPDQR